MSLLRIHGSLRGPPQQCRWALINAGLKPVVGAGRLDELPRRAERVELVVPAAQVLITRVSLPPAARRHTGAVLAYAVEEQIVGEPDANHVSWLGAVKDAAGSADVLAVVEREGLTRWREALGAVGIHAYEVRCETLLLPWAAGVWSLAWDGREGHVRNGEFEGAATDCGARDAPPLALRLMLDAAQKQGARPASIALYTTATGAAPDLAAWTRELGIAVRLAGAWDWHMAPAGTGVCLTQERNRWHALTGVAVRLRPAAWIVGAALAIQALALATDWASLAREQRTLRQHMEAQFRAVFPEAVAVVDPVLQMRRKLAEARHAAGLADSGDLLPMLEQVAAGTRELPAGSVRIMSYEGGRITLELVAIDEAAVRRALARWRQAGLSVEPAISAVRAGGSTVVVTVRSS